MKHLFRVVVVTSLPLIAWGCPSGKGTRAADDEAPIRVTGGSLTVSLDADDGELKSTNSGGARTDYKHVPANGKVHKGELYVLTLFFGQEPFANFCASKAAKTVTVYHADGFNVSFGIDDSGGTKTTTVHSSRDFDDAQPTKLTHNATSDRVSHVVTTTNSGPAQWKCEGEPGSIKEVRICSSDSRDDCKKGQ